MPSSRSVASRRSSSSRRSEEVTRSSWRITSEYGARGVPRFASNTSFHRFSGDFPFLGIQRCSGYLGYPETIVRASAGSKKLLSEYGRQKTEGKSQESEVRSQNFVTGIQRNAAEERRLSWRIRQELAPCGAVRSSSSPL